MSRILISFFLFFAAASTVSTAVIDYSHNSEPIVDYDEHANEILKNFAIGPFNLGDVNVNYRFIRHEQDIYNYNVTGAVVAQTNRVVFNGVTEGQQMPDDPNLHSMEMSFVIGRVDVDSKVTYQKYGESQAKKETLSVKSSTLKEQEIINEVKTTIVFDPTKKLVVQSIEARVVLTAYESTGKCNTRVCYDLLRELNGNLDIFSMARALVNEVKKMLISRKY